MENPPSTQGWTPDDEFYILQFGPEAEMLRQS